MQDRKPEDYRKAADDSMELAKVLAGQGKIGDQDFLERMARSDSLVEHDGETCGLCCQMIIGATVAREMIEAGEYEDVVSKWADEARRRWEHGKFFKVWQEETKAGRDPRKEFEKRGWEP
ncbi:MAG TPA: hypothetical protein VKA46_04625 [Gemmataceae bacterium]|nr:hypothetical protein [Gemmataceae bacterium]